MVDQRGDEVAESGWLDRGGCREVAIGVLLWGTDCCDNNHGWTPIRQECTKISRLQNASRVLVRGKFPTSSTLNSFKLTKFIRSC